ncbi:hypothetical protein [Tunturiibacter psychrotolerans]|uniref:hypothetical protein n=1 Tax=Tunturiibacter psychrotolerans TaxID=3069686 RepID=UPI003D214E94
MTENLENWPTSFTDTIPVDVDEVSAEAMLRSYHLQFSDIPDSYPAIPHFGVLYLGIPRAVSLIVRDLFILTPHRYPARPESVPAAEHTARLEKIDAGMEAAVESHLLRAIANGHLASVKTSGDIEDFLAHGDGLASKRTFIFFKDLVNWLAKNGYGEILDSPMTAFGEYLDSELALAKEVEELVLKRRRLQEFDDSELAPFTEYKGIWSLRLDHALEVDKRLEAAKREIRALQLRINRMLESPTQRRLHKKEQDSILIVLAALLELKGHKELDKDLVSKIERKTEHIDRGLSTNTIRRWLGEAIDLIPRSEI